MQGDRQIVVIGRPQLLKQHFGLRARVDEEQRRAMRLQLAIDIGDGIFGGVARPGDALFGRKDRDIGLGATLDNDEAGVALFPRLLRHQPFLQVHGIGNGRRKADGLHMRRQLADAGKAEGQHMTALGGDERMQLIEDDVFQILEEALGFAIGEQQRDLLRGRQQDIRWIELLPLALAAWRIARAVLDRDRQPHFGNGLHQVALDIDRKRLQRRNVERMNAGEGRTGRDLAAPGDIRQRRQEAGERLAGAGGRNQQRAFTRFGAGQQFQLMRTRLPALFRKPAGEGGRQGNRGLRLDLVHGVQCNEYAADEKPGRMVKHKDGPHVLLPRPP